MTLLKYLLLFTPLVLAAQPGQISVPRVELMPDEPAPFNVRDWQEVALKYDSFVYDVTRTGLHLPLSYLLPSGINYPQNPFFGLHTYVGTNSPLGNEAINVLPSLVGATLAGADKTDQYGRNWVLMSQNFFNKNNGQLIYLNNPNTSSGNDWWYDLMPNVFFYQLYDLYPDIGGDADFQFGSVADRFLGAVRGMGGSATPWQKAYMNYRAWNFMTMQPNAAGVPEPEAAGAYAWVLYNAYVETGNPAYLQGAEWSLEFLSEWTSNPSYELMLPYGTYTAARMNAELGTGYDVEKMVNWSFNRGPLRGWGTIVGNWGGFDVSGLVGEANDNGNDYAFQLNGVQQAAALVPMVRYDKRFARAIGKWTLNLANATRLFYPGFLPGSLQDATAWSTVHDPDRVIGYEALREQWQGNAPFSTGDAVNGGWAATNLSLYSTSSIGYLGAIVEKTNVPKILRLDLLKTDFFGPAAYPSYLYYNPYDQPRTVEITVGPAPADVYNTLTETFLLQGVTGTVSLTIPADQAVLAVLTPAGGAITFDRNKMLIDGTVVDYRQTLQPFQYGPRIQALAAAEAEVEFGDSTAVFSQTSDLDSDSFTWSWSASGGTISGSGPTVQWIAPAIAGDYTITLIVTDEGGQSDTATVEVKAVAEINLAPELPGIEKSAEYVAPGGTLQLTAPATDPNNDPLTFAWTGTGGSLGGGGSTVSWTAPAGEGIFQVNVTVTDDEGLSAQATTTILVKNFIATAGDLIAYYPFTGNAADASGNQLHGVAGGGLLYVPDFWGNPAQAARFDGLNDRVTVANSPILNFQDAITVSAWFRPQPLPDHETFLISHGSWQNRWKISFTPEGKIRWTVNTLSAIGDLDSEISVAADSVYHLTVTYDGSLMALYLDGRLHSYKPLNGLIRTAALPLLIGQMLPDNTDFNYPGIIDEVKIFDHALIPDEVQALFDNMPTGLAETTDGGRTMILSPNPANDLLTVQLPGTPLKKALFSIIDLNGNIVFEQAAGAQTDILINTEHWKSGIYTAVIRTETIFQTLRFIKI